MRLDARASKVAWSYRVFDCDICAFRYDVVWVDDAESCYGVYRGMNPANDGLVTRSVGAKILIISDARIVSINPKVSMDELINEVAVIILEGGENEFVKPV